MTNHALAALGQRHAVHDWEVADSAALAALVPTSDDIGKIAWQQDDDSFHFLSDDSPVTWVGLGTGGGGGSASGDAGDIQYSDGAGGFDSSSPGRLAWTEGVDETDSSLNVDGTLIVFSALVATNIGTPRISSAGEIDIVVAGDLEFNGDPGTAGQILQSNGSGSPPTWEDNAGGYTDENVRDVIAGAIIDSTSIAFANTDGSDTMTFTVKDEYLMDWLGTLVTDTTNIDITYNDGSNTFTIGLTAAARTFGASFLIDGGGSVIVAGVKGCIVVERTGTISAATMVADASGNLILDIKKSTYSGFPTVSSIVASAPPTLSGVQKSQDTTLTGWTTSVTAGDVLEISVTGTPATITRCTLALRFVAAA